MKFLRLKEVIALTGLKRSTIYARVSAGTFPKCFKLGTGSRASAWRSDEIEAWMRACTSASATKGSAA